MKTRIKNYVFILLLVTAASMKGTLVVLVYVSSGIPYRAMR